MGDHEENKRTNTYRNTGFWSWGIWHERSNTYAFHLRLHEGRRSLVSWDETS
jgi:hypothetical protein